MKMWIILLKMIIYKYIQKLPSTVLSLVRDRVLNYLRKFINIWPIIDRYWENDVTLSCLMSKHQKHNLKKQIWNMNDDKKYQNMEVSKFLYFALVNFNLMPFTLWSSIFFPNQFTDSLLHGLHPVLVNYEILLDWMMSEAFQCYRRK